VFLQSAYLKKCRVKLASLADTVGNWMACGRWNATAEVRILESERGGLGERGQWSMLAFAAAAAASTAGRSSRGQAGSRTLHLNNIARARNTRHKIERLRVADKAVTDLAGSGASVRKHTGTHAERGTQTDRATDGRRENTRR